MTLPDSVKQMSLEERQQLALDIINYCNLCPTLWNGNYTKFLPLILNVITDPRKSEKLILQSSRVISLLKKNKELWNKVKLFLCRSYWKQICKCKHGAGFHHYAECTVTTCLCKNYEEKEL